MPTLIALDLVMRIYSEAIEPTRPATHGRDWWLQVQQELSEVVAARSNKEAGEFIEWWHHDWSQFNDTPTRAAGRIRRAAAKLIG